MNLVRCFIIRVAAQFGNPSGWMGRTLTVVMNMMNRRLYRCVEREIEDRRPESVLDVGFGNGMLLARLAAGTTVKALRGVDISEDMVANAARRCAAEIESGRVQLSMGSVMKLPFADRSFDAIYTVNTHYFWPDAEGSFREIARVMKPGAVFLLAGYEKKWLEGLEYTRYGFNLYTDNQLEELIGRAGLVLHRKEVVVAGKSYYLIVENKR